MSFTPLSWPIARFRRLVKSCCRSSARSVSLCRHAQHCFISSAITTPLFKTSARKLEATNALPFHNAQTALYTPMGYMQVKVTSGFRVSGHGLNKTDSTDKAPPGQNRAGLALLLHAAIREGGRHMESNRIIELSITWSRASCLQRSPGYGNGRGKGRANPWDSRGCRRSCRHNCR